MNSNKSSSASRLEEKQDNLFVQRRLAGAVAREKERLEKEGHEVPHASIYVGVDTREKFDPEKKFTKSFHSKLNDIRNEFGLSTAEMGVIFTLSFHIGYEDNLLYHENGTPLKKRDLYKILDLAHNAVDKYINSLVDKGILAKVKVKRSVNYYLNPYIFYRGNRIDNTLLNMFNKAK
ncbi:hypothetical protein [Paramaledivibacter caminithermalis]|jgi:predicted transcriptional regulator|uniref:Plasmid replication protein RepL domain-containing protein n=1 Tax=Paramaledivibacter caminithermalis (strain DSM 15212 / CIP 107654 / DViRD3) TaxID=1121301 RepID=A0A1M6NAK3_PARC5|nr:hypothetical protein [Paramaledivibacter caminithermalis]SHJ92749.1 hypothetical protein SAMN02745912_01636 [Paramaledivibacter caminithermalis DSM 15212]